MEATAEWATKEYALAELDGTPQGEVIVRSGREMPSFFETTSEHLSYGNHTMSTFRHYGAVVAVEFFTQQLGQDFVRHSWESLSAEYYLDGISQLQATLYNHYYGDVAGWLPYMWDSLYNMCDPAHYDGQMSGIAITYWCAAMPPLVSFPPAASAVRPLHTASSSRSGETAHALSGGGAFFHDLGMPASDMSAHLRVKLTASRTASLSVLVGGWGSSPADVCAEGYWASMQGQAEDPSADLVVEAILPAGCDNATIEVIDTDLSNPSHDIEVTWSGWEDGAVIGNGTITLGVTTDGSLGIGSPPDEFCRGMGARVPASSGAAVRSSLTYGDGVGPGLVDEATSFDAIRESWHEMCQGYDMGEGWSVADPNQDLDGHAATWFKSRVQQSGVRTAVSVSLRDG